MDGKKKRRLLWVLFVLYLAMLLLLLFHRTPRGERACNLVPLYTIRNWMDFFFRDDPLAASLRRFSILNLAGNLFVLLPMGIFLPILFPRMRFFLHFLLCATAFVCLVEALQFVSMRGALDVDDLILNVPGACLGWLIWRIWRKKDA